MDPRNRADDALDRARARGAFVVTPDSATSPMDASSTERIPRDIIDDADRDSNSTVVLSHSPQQEPSERSAPSHGGWPPDGYGQFPYDQGGFGPPQYGQPQYDQSQPGRPQYGQPPYAQPPYNQSHPDQLRYGQPQYGQPQYGQLDHGQSQTMPPNPYGSQRTTHEFAPPGSWAAQQYPNPEDSPDPRS
ncbi:hypothetical protein [Haloactinomyces albus]|uniref:Uncharacterized protein n=1 Tax=Haloactinomyces albus TaxID=1352928 RepID=A0AAE3ZD38_9ACTN|nr:hypothetical protein [Haloactinomyces albus]MDR7301309.1 hypothetical protein [Haloactinomyces albus]